MANSGDSDETVHHEPSHLDLHCLHKYLFWSVRLKGQTRLKIQQDFNDLNTDWLFTIANLNLFLSPWEVLPTAQENKYLGVF